MSTTVDPTGRRAGWEAIAAALLLFPVSLFPLAMASFDWRAVLYTAIAIGLTGVYLHASRLFARERNHATSRRLLLTSLVYLPGWLAGLTLLAL